ncbi:MAG: hypothetical protein ACR2PI_07320 [Hyphomicrobiaceae bacterium]
MEFKIDNVRVNAHTMLCRYHIAVEVARLEGLMRFNAVRHEDAKAGATPLL